MLVHLTAVFGYVLAGVMASALLYLWRRLVSMQTISEDQERQLSDALQDLGKVTSARERAEKQLAKQTLLVHKAAEEKSRLSTHLSGKLEELEQALTGERARSTENENMRAHLESENRTLSEQIRSADKERTEWQKRYDQEIAQHSSRADKELEKLRDEVATLKREAERARKKSEERGEAAAKVHEELAPFKKKAQEMERKARRFHLFYRTIHGQREMLAERLAQWEEALGRLARWITEHHTGAAPNSREVGAQVVEALRLIEPPTSGKNTEDDDELPQRSVASTAESPHL